MSMGRAPAASRLAPVLAACCLLLVSAAAAGPTRHVLVSYSNDRLLPRQTVGQCPGFQKKLCLFFWARVLAVHSLAKEEGNYSGG
jgi:hypothetical protein